MTALLSVRDVRAAYGPIEVLHGVDLEVPTGSVVAVLGPNGAGKTTLLSVLAGLHPATSGSIVLAGRRINGARADDLARAGLCLVPEGRGIFANLTVHEHLRMVTHSGRRLRDIEAETYERFPRLAERRTQVAGTLSGGEQQMLAMARAMMSRPKLLLLDEPSMGLAPLMVERIFEVVRTIASEGVTLLLVEQNARLALEASPRGYVLDGGHITIAGESRSLLGDPREREASLGE
jgi:branched-chain amino acid transport system ATP-binding protein